MNKVDRIKREIAELQKELDKAEKLKNQYPIRSLDSYSVEEKVECFDRFYQMAASHLEEVEGGVDDDDIEHWTFEAVMELLSSPETNIWKYYNSLLE